jgi:hypothetical protein
MVGERGTGGEGWIEGVVYGHVQQSPALFVFVFVYSALARLTEMTDESTKRLQIRGFQM